MWCLLAASAVGWFGTPGPRPLPERWARAAAVVVGKVTAIETRPVRTEFLPNLPRVVEYHVAIVKVEEAVWGAAGLTHVKVGFLPLQRPDEPRAITIAGPVLRAGQEALFYLRDHYKESFLVPTGYFEVVERKNEPAWDDEVALCRKAAKVLAHPVAALRAKEARDRFQAAGLLLARYRTPPLSRAPQESVPAEESRLLLRALAEADWASREIGLAHPEGLFGLLGLTQKDGWIPPDDFRERAAAAKKWLDRHANTYRVKRFVAER